MKLSNSMPQGIRRILGVSPPGRMPNFFISGAARAGTTSMWQYLRQHPQVFMPPVFEKKEPSFFCDTYGMKDITRYQALFKEAGNRPMVGEASGPYLTSPESPARIRAVVPDARFIIMLRNPADRAFSLYTWMRHQKYETETSFAAALAAEGERRTSNKFRRENGQYYYNFLYFSSGLYGDQLERFWRCFGRERVHVVVFEEFKQRPLEAVRHVFSFLGVDPTFKPHIEIHNANPKHDESFDLGLRKMLLARYETEIARVGNLLQRDLKSLWV